MGLQRRGPGRIAGAAGQPVPVVAFSLPVTTDCNVDGAICTKDGSGRKLSNSLSFTSRGAL